MADGVFTLPEDTGDRLRAVDDDPHLAQYFYPLITKHAGEEITAFGTVMMLTLAVSDYVSSRDLPPIMLRALEISVHRYARALVPGEHLAEVLGIIRMVGLPDQ